MLTSVPDIEFEGINVTFLSPPPFACAGPELPQFLMDRYQT